MVWLANNRAPPGKYNVSAEIDGCWTCRSSDIAFRIYQYREALTSIQTFTIESESSPWANSRNKILRRLETLTANYISQDGQGCISQTAAVMTTWDAIYISGDYCTVIILSCSKLGLLVLLVFFWGTAGRIFFSTSLCTLASLFITSLYFLFCSSVIHWPWTTSINPDSSNLFWYFIPEQNWPWFPTWSHLYPMNSSFSRKHKNKTKWL